MFLIGCGRAMPSRGRASTTESGWRSSMVRCWRYLVLFVWLMTFDHEGVAGFSTQLTTEAKLLLVGTSVAHRPLRLVSAHQPYVAYHRRHVIRDALDTFHPTST
jgi:hypothetical protein